MIKDEEFWHCLLSTSTNRQSSIPLLSALVTAFTAPVPPSPTSQRISAIEARSSSPKQLSDRRASGPMGRSPLAFRQEASTSEEQSPSSAAGHEPFDPPTSRGVLTPPPNLPPEVNHKQPATSGEATTNFADPEWNLAVRILQHTLPYLGPDLNSMMCHIPALSMSYNASCVIESNGHVRTFGSLHAPEVHPQMVLKSCVCGDSYFAFLTQNDEVWISGQFEQGLTTNAVATTTTSSSNTLPNSVVNPSNPYAVRGIASRCRMVSGKSSRLVALSHTQGVRPLSAVPLGTRNLFPYRQIRYIEVGLSEDCFMVGVDNVLYKTNTSTRSVGTPRRSMTVSKIGVYRVACGSSFTYFTDLHGRVYSMGKNKKGQLGNGKKQEVLRKPQLHQEVSQHYVVALSCGESHALVLTSSGLVYGAGSNELGQLGLGKDVSLVLQLTLIPLPAKCHGIFAGPVGSMFACKDGCVYTCGSNECNQLGLLNQTEDHVVFRPTRVGSVHNGIVSMTLDGALVGSVGGHTGGASGGPKLITPQNEASMGTVRSPSNSQSTSAREPTQSNNRRPGSPKVAAKCCNCCVFA